MNIIIIIMVKGYIMTLAIVLQIYTRTYIHIYSCFKVHLYTKLIDVLIHHYSMRIKYICTFQH